jgi:hypothetical protein
MMLSHKSRVRRSWFMRYKVAERELMPKMVLTAEGAEGAEDLKEREREKLQRKALRSPRSLRFTFALHAGFVLLMLLYFAAAAWLTFRLPPFIAPNELLNYEYISVMRQIGGLPNRGLVDVEIRYNEWHQPPVYFLWAGLVSAAVPVDPAPNPPPPLEVAYNPFFGSTPRGNLNPYLPDVYQQFPLYLPSRLAAALFGMLCLALFYRWTSRLYAPLVALLMVALIAFQPNFLFFSAGINNDMPLTAVSAVTLALAVWVVARDKGAWAWFGLGLAAALTILTKANGVFVLAYLGAAWLLQLWQSRQLGQSIKLGLAAGLGLFPLWGAWLLLNAIRMRDALGVSGSLPVRDVLLEGPRHLLLLIPFLPQIWQSFWLDWSVGDLAYGAAGVYLLGVGLVLAGLAGWLVPRPWTSFTLPHPARLLWIPLLGAGMISLLYFAVKALSAYREGWITPEGRWWLPVWPALVWLMVLGLATLVAGALAHGGECGSHGRAPSAHWLPIPRLPARYLSPSATGGDPAHHGANHPRRLAVW